MRYVERAVFRASPERVWAILSDWEGQAAWMPDVAWIRFLGPGRELGARLAVKTKVFGVPFATDEVRVTAWKPPRLLAVEHLGVVRGVGEWRLEPIEGGTRFTWLEAFRMPPPILGDLGLWLYSPVQRWMLERSVRNLRRLVEADP
jgi:uncharacterized protein YndB with AHSA1/START domain